jgi:hypothetical protein
MEKQPLLSRRQSSPPLPTAYDYATSPPVYVPGKSARAYHTSFWSSIPYEYAPLPCVVPVPEGSPRPDHHDPGVIGRGASLPTFFPGSSLPSHYSYLDDLTRPQPTPHPFPTPAPPDSSPIGMSQSASGHPHLRRARTVSGPINGIIPAAATTIQSEPLDRGGALEGDGPV